ncbi:MAG: reverse transcriptase/maturase family protein [Lactobacillus sp.]|jgi:hypothetical protein|nr:reverse transcriptase/maturase family protein [Lactobacillus sp.]MCI2033423.1 reverse transcriptase/maturase family protein [Lactobacillus sp.]
MDEYKQVGLRALDKINGKNYLHFDFPLTDKERRQLVADFSNGDIVHHRYLPFISFEIRFRIYHPKEKSATPKSRKITLPSHHDALTYRYYGAALNRVYSNYANSHYINEVAVAYRERRSGLQLSNITTAKEVFDYVTLFPNSWIIKGDFHHFFDTLNHQYLVDNMRKVFGGVLPRGWGRMLRSITEYQSISRKTLERQLKDSHVKNAYRLNVPDGAKTRAYVSNLQQFGQLIKQKKVRLSGKNRVGIPQGTAVSAVLANVYMIDFDEWLSKYCETLGGLYRRYSDDFIIVLPKKHLSKGFVEILESEIIQRSQSTLDLDIEPTKTKLYSYNQDSHAVMLHDVQNAEKQKPGKIDYLGFIFDGVSVSMRPKSIYKFIYRGRRKIGKYITLGRSYDQVRLGLSDSEIILNKGVPKYIKHSGDTQRIYAAPNLHEVEKSLGRLQQIRKMRYETLSAVHKGVTTRYLSTEVKKPRSSMLGYALRAQKIFETGQPKYRVVIRRQVMRQIKRNQLRLHRGRESYKYWRYFNL